MGRRVKHIMRVVLELEVSAADEDDAVECAQDAVKGCMEVGMDGFQHDDGYVEDWIVREVEVVLVQDDEGGNDLPGMMVGRKVRLLHDVDRFPYGVCPAGSTGFITEFTHERVAVQMEEYFPWLNEWDNNLKWYPQNGGDLGFLGSLEVIE